MGHGISGKTQSGGRITLAQWRVILLASLGGALEFYDFVIFGLFAQYIGATFFPATDPLVSLMFSFAVFATGYLARPIGGIVLGHFGDRYGRRRVFIFSILAMTGSTTAIGLLPGYAQWGLAAPVLMVLLRILQGFCLGGELPGAITYVAETAPRRAGFAAGVIFFCVNSGVGIASLLSLILHSLLSPDAMALWGWRFCFLFGGALGLLSFWLRLSLEESQAFASLRSHASALPFVDLMRDHWPEVIVGVGVAAATAGFNGLLFAMPAFLPSALGYAPLEAIEAQNVCLAILSVGLIIAARIGDIVPRHLILCLGGALAASLAYGFFAAAADRTINLLVLAALAGLVASLLNGSFPGILADLFPTRLRFSGVAIVFNLAFTIFSGIAPLVATALVAATGAATGAAYYMIGCGLFTLIAGLLVPRYAGKIMA